MPIILDKDILTGEPTVKVINRKGVCHFNGTEKQLIELLKDNHSMAESIEMDLDAGNISEENDCIAIEQYREFAKKY